MRIWDKLTLFALHQLFASSRYDWFTLRPITSCVMSCISRRYALVATGDNTAGTVSSSLNELVAQGILQRGWRRVRGQRRRAYAIVPNISVAALCQALAAQVRTTGNLYSTGPCSSNVTAVYNNIVNSESSENNEQLPRLEPLEPGTPGSELGSLLLSWNKLALLAMYRLSTELGSTSSRHSVDSIVEKVVALTAGEHCGDNIAGVVTSSLRELAARGFASCCGTWHLSNSGEVACLCHTIEDEFQHNGNLFCGVGNVYAAHSSRQYRFATQALRRRPDTFGLPAGIRRSPTGIQRMPTANPNRSQRAVSMDMWSSAEPRTLNRVPLPTQESVASSLEVAYNQKVAQALKDIE